MDGHSAKKRRIAAFLQTVTDDAEVQTLLAYSVGRVLMKREAVDYDPGRHPDHFSNAKHVADWIAAAVANGDAWLSNTDALGRPKKLLKFPTLDAAVREADKAMLFRAQEGLRVKVADGDEELVMRLEDGYYIVRLLTPAALDRESGEMQHCIGNGGYDHRLTHGGYRYLSLRGPTGRPHATLEIVGTKVSEIQGKQNKLPKTEYLRRLCTFLRAEELDLGSCLVGQRFAFDQEYNLVDTWDLSGCEEHQGDIRFSNAEVRLPNRLRVRGSVHFNRCTFPDGFPETLEVDGALTVKQCRSFTLPRNIEACLGISIAGCSVTGRIDKLATHGSLVVAGTNIDKLPRKISVGGSVDLSKTAIRTLKGLPDVVGDLSFANTAVSEMPSELVIGGSLDASSTRLDRYPDGVSIGGSVDVSHTRIAVLPPVRINGRLNITCTKITELTDGLSVNDLSAHGLSLKRFDKGVEVKGNLDLSYSDTVLPENLTIPGTLDVRSSKIVALPNRLKADRVLAASSRLAEIGTGVKIQGELDICSTLVRALPGDLRVEGDILARQTHISLIGEGFECGRDLDLTQASIVELPEGMRVGRSLILHANDIDVLPDVLSVGKDLVICDPLTREISPGVEVGGEIRSYSHGVIRAAPETKPPRVSPGMAA